MTGILEARGVIGVGRFTLTCVCRHDIEVSLPPGYPVGETAVIRCPRRECLMSHPIRIAS